jgi:hypothetical protein
MPTTNKFIEQLRDFYSDDEVDYILKFIAWSTQVPTVNCSLTVIGDSNAAMSMDRVELPEFPKFLERGPR